MGIGPGNLEQIQYLGVIWQVKSYNSSTNEITVEDGLGDAAGFVANMWAGGYLFWLPGSKNAGAYTSISANGADTITCTPPNAPVAGDQFLIRLNAQVTVNAPENLAQWAGIGVAEPDSNGYPIFTMGGVSQPAADSTTTTLAANGVYTTATPFSLTDARGIVGTIFSDQSGTLQVEQSPDGTHWDVSESIYYPGGSAGLEFRLTVVTPGASQGRLVYTNGATAQTTFRLYAWATPQPVPVMRSFPQQAAATNTITTAATAQSLFSAMPGRHGFMIQNPSTATGQGIAAAESLWIQYGTDATMAPPSIEVVTGALIILDTAVDPRSISVIAATAGHAFTATQW